MRYAEEVGLTTRKSEKTFEKRLNAIGDILSGLASSDDEEDGEDEEEDEEVTELGKLSEDDEPSWVIGTICKMVQQHMESYRQKQMTFDQLT